MEDREIQALLNRAMDIVEGSKVPSEVQGVALDAAIALLTNGSREEQQVPRSSAGVAHAASSVLEGIAQRLSLKQEVVEDVFYVEDDGRIGVALPSSRLDPTKAGGTKQLALLLCVARQAGGLEEWTSSAEIRRVCMDYGRYDSNNFGATLQEMAEAFQLRGSRTQREVRVRRAGFEEGAELVAALAGGRRP